MTNNLNKFLSVTRRALRIRRHAEFYYWLQNDIWPLLPHDVLVAVWGDFRTGELYYDVTSPITELRTNSISDGLELKRLGDCLYRRSLQGASSGWCQISDFEFPLPAKSAVTGSTSILAGMKSVLVYRMRNKRGTHDCLYAFFSQNEMPETDPQLLELLMPYIDITLRRLECNQLADKDNDIIDIEKLLSSREHQVMSWVCEGKSNQEIGTILSISHNTVKNHLKRVFDKLAVTSRSQAVRIFLQSHNR